MDRFYDKITPVTESGCWLWEANTNAGGYGTIGYKGKIVKAHRLSYILHNGDIPDGLHVLHKCDVRCCVNPDHLFVGTHLDNMRDCSKKGRKSKKPVNVGESNARCKLTDDQVSEIRASSENYKAIAGRYDVNPSTISRIKSGKRRSAPSSR